MTDHLFNRGRMEMADQHKPATVMPVIGRDGKLLAVTINGIACVRPNTIDWDDWAGWILWRIAALPRDRDSIGAKALLDQDDKRIASLHD